MNDLSFGYCTMSVDLLVSSNWRSGSIAVGNRPSARFEIRTASPRTFCRSVAGQEGNPHRTDRSQSVHSPVRNPRPVVEIDEYEFVPGLEFERRRIEVDD